MNLEEGILLIDKPSGITSFDVIRNLRRLYSASHNGSRAPKLGHAGTLDPLATGLMVLGVGKGTKELSHLVKLDKEYVAEILLGESRTTGDMEGKVVKECEVAEMFSKENISATLLSMLGTLRLPVSAYSAIKVDGKPMYKRAREAATHGEMVEEVPVRDMTVHEAECLGTELAHVDNRKRQIVKVRFVVGSGTYIRSLAEEFGKRLGGYPACVYSLRRTKVGEFDIKDAHKLEDFS